jgi:hypothetical protein
MIPSCLEMPFPLTAETGAERDKLAAAIGKHNDACCELTTDEGNLKAVAAADWDASHDRAAGKLRERKISLNADEIQVRESVDQFYDQVARLDFPAASNAAIAEFDNATKEVTAAMASIGFVDGQVEDASGSFVRGIDFGMLGRHPRVKAARMARDAMQGARPCHEAKGLNLQALNRCKEKTAELKRRGVALLA